MRVSDDSPAEDAGLTPGDIILAMGGQKIDNLPDFYKRLWSSGAPGVEVTLKVLHGSEIREVTVKSIDRAQMLRRKPTI
jgi:S1-C subfamily serine protease